VSDLADAVLPLIRTRADLWRWSAANEHGSYGRGAAAFGGCTGTDAGRSPIASMRRYASAAAGCSIGSGRPVAMSRSSARSMPALSAAVIWRARAATADRR